MWLEERDNWWKEIKKTASVSNEIWDVISDAWLFKLIQAWDFSYIEKLTSLDLETAIYLRENFTWFDLDLANVSEISLEVADILKDISTYVLKIWLNSNNKIEVFEKILQSKSGSIIFSWLDMISWAVAWFVPFFEGISLWFRAVKELDPKVAPKLANFLWELQFENLNLTLEIIEWFAWFKGQLHIDSDSRELNLDDELIQKIKDLNLVVKFKKRKHELGVPLKYTLGK